jgi:hypothetical protein
LITSNLFVLIEEIEILLFKKWARNLSNIGKKNLWKIVIDYYIMALECSKWVCLDYGV